MAAHSSAIESADKPAFWRALDAAVNATLGTAHVNAFCPTDCTTKYPAQHAAFGPAIITTIESALNAAFCPTEHAAFVAADITALVTAVRSAQ